MTGRMVEVCEVEVRGKVQSTGRGKDNDVTYVRFFGGGGQVTVLVPDGIPMGNGQLRQGASLVARVNVEQRGNFTVIRAFEVDTWENDGAES